MLKLVRDPLRGASVAHRTAMLARSEWHRVALVVALSLASAVLEGVGLSFLIPLAAAFAGGSGSPAPIAPGGFLGYLSGFASQDPMHIVLLIATLFIAGTIIGYANAVVSSVLAMRFAHDLRARVFDYALSRPVILIEGLPQGKFVNTLAGETWRASEAIFVVINVIVQGAAVVVFTTLLVLISPLYTLLFGLMAVSVAVLVYFATMSVRRLGRVAVAVNESFMAYVWDAVAGLRLIRGFGRERHERERFAARSQAIVDVFVRLQLVSGLVGPLVRIATVAIVVALVMIAIARGEQASALIGFLAIAYRMQPRVAAILRSETKLRELDASISEIARVVRHPARAGGASVALGRISRGIVLDGVTASYPNAEHPALVDVCCTFEVGRITAVVGPSGAGKSTLAALLLRFLEPTGGEVLVDGVPLSRMDPEDWHRRIAFVEHSAFLFNASVRENIAYGCEGPVEPDAIWRAAGLAQADAFIRGLPNGLDTMVGDNGYRLSHGQRQRIALARALLRDPEVLILDEATNALDLPTEESFRVALHALRPRRIVIVIAHRRETCEGVDEVVVLDGGRVVEAGKPADLRSRKGVFARLQADGILAARQTG